MKKLLLTLLFFTLPISAFANRLPVTVDKVVDGDTFIAFIDNKKERVRLIGIDTPETKHPRKGVQFYGKEAFEFTKSQLKGRIVYLEFDVGQRDRYGRILAYVWLSDKDTTPRKMFNSILLLNGYAQLMTIPPNVKYVEYFKTYQTKARENNYGLWQGDKNGIK